VTAPHPFQVALARALELPEEFYQRLRDEYWARKQILCEALCRAGLSYYEPGGSYFLWCEYSRLSDEDDATFCERLLREAGVAGVAGSVFYPCVAGNPRRMRFTFSKSRATIEEAARRLARNVCSDRR
jgi:aspartate/methionine/tyrosine aminotransferase